MLIRISVFSVLLFFVFGMANGQESLIKYRWNAKLGYAQYPGDYSPSQGYWQNGNRNLRLELNYGISKYLESGIYFGLNRINVFRYETIDSGQLAFRDQGLMTYYGINANFHILPLFIHADDFRFDLYVASKLGAMYSPSFVAVSYNHNKRLSSEYDIGLGLAFYPTKHIGAFVEYGYGKLTDLRFGVSLKFNN